MLGGLCAIALVFTFPKCSRKTGYILILAPAVFLRALLWPAPPSDDVNRYLWEGQLVLHSQNPYQAPASDPQWQKWHNSIWEGINHRDKPTAYPPGIMWILAATAAISPSILAFKAIAILGDITVLVLILQLLKTNCAPIRWAGFYAFNPVTLIAFAAEAHFDSIMIAAMLLAILCYNKHIKCAWLCLAIAIQVKLVCLVLLPLFLTRKSIKSSWLFILALALPGLPFVTALPQWITGVREFAGGTNFNGPAFSVLSLIGVPENLIRSLLVTAFLVFSIMIIIAKQRGASLIHTCLWMLSLLLILSPIVHFWYIAWLLPLVALAPSFAWSIASITIGTYFIAWWTLQNRGWWGFGHGISTAIWSLPALAGLAQNRFILARIRNARIYPLANTVTTVVPVLNPDTLLTKFFDSHTDSTSITVVDGGSETLPAPPVDRPNITIISTQPGRGNQIAAGIAHTSEDWILIAHIDAAPPPHHLRHLKNAIKIHPQATMFVYGQRFDENHFKTLLIEILNEVRIVFGGVAFGDQTMVLRRSALASAGGFPEQPLMEDVEVSMRMAAHGAIVYLGQEWTLSAEKWQQSFTQRFRMIIRLVASYQIARLKGKNHAAKVSEKMYREYYPQKPKPLPPSPSEE